MKRNIILTLSIIILLLSVGCSNSEKYPYDNIGLYDSTTRQYICVGDTKDTVTKKLGSGSFDGHFFDYSDKLTIRYSDDNTVEYLKVYFDWMSSFNGNNNNRYTFPDGIGYTSNVTDFIDKYKYVYEYDYFGTSEHPDICIFVEKRNDGNYLLSKDDLINLSKNNEYDGKIYQLSVCYFAYDDIEWITIDNVKYPHLYNWDEILTEVK